MRGFTLIEILIGAAVLVIAIVALLGAFLGQITLNEHSRNLTLAMNDANRVMEQMRQINTGAGCSTPRVAPPGVFTSWDAWLNAPLPTGGGNKSLQPNPTTEERIVVTCQNQNGTAYCASTQFGTGEWHGAGGAAANPMRVTVAVCWRHRNRTLGECNWTGVLSPNDALPMPNDTAGVIDSPAMLSTLITCRT